mmetsp:Transcript_5066/g.12775  ORF Transcript_5066/g.12775 Transcript_5066/m.12775 type:complete len:212 (-) Transcript_5066:143-778(-)
MRNLLLQPLVGRTKLLHLCLAVGQHALRLCPARVAPLRRARALAQLLAGGIQLILKLLEPRIRLVRLRTHALTEKNELLPEGLVIALQIKQLLVPPLQVLRLPLRKRRQLVHLGPQSLLLCVRIRLRRLTLVPLVQIPVLRRRRGLSPIAPIVLCLLLRCGLRLQRGLRAVALAVELCRQRRLKRDKLARGFGPRGSRRACRGLPGLGRGA